MSKTQLQTNNAKLEALITELQGKAAGGGGAAETCTVTVKGTSSYARPYYISYTTNEEEAGKVIESNNSLSVTLENVLCGSVVTVRFYSSAEANSFNVTNATMLTFSSSSFVVFRITATDGGTATIQNNGSSGGGSVD